MLCLQACVRMRFMLSVNIEMNTKIRECHYTSRVLAHAERKPTFTYFTHEYTPETGAIGSKRPRRLALHLCNLLLSFGGSLVHDSLLWCFMRCRC
jgi:hypothetical protein